MTCYFVHLVGIAINTSITYGVGGAILAKYQLIRALFLIRSCHCFRAASRGQAFVSLVFALFFCLFPFSVALCLEEFAFVLAHSLFFAALCLAAPRYFAAIAIFFLEFFVISTFVSISLLPNLTAYHAAVCF